MPRNPIIECLPRSSLRDTPTSNTTAAKGLEFVFEQFLYDFHFTAVVAHATIALTHRARAVER
jgi:hypothetical protein